MFERFASYVITAAWVVTFLSTRWSPELASAAIGLTWLIAALLIVRGGESVRSLRATLSGLAAVSIGCVWVSDAFGVVDPASAWTWTLGWAGPVAAGFVVARSGASRVASLRGVAWLGAGLGGAHLLAYAAGSARAAVLFTNPNVSAAVLVGIVPLSLYLEARRDQVIAAALCLGGLAATGSRGGMLAALIMVGVYVISQRGDRRAWLAALSLSLLMVPFAAHRLARLAEDPHAHGRAMWWRSAWQVSQDVPAGVGTRQFGWYGLKRRVPADGPVYRYLRGEAGESAHSEWLQLLVDHSPLGVALLLLCAGASLVHLRRAPEVLALSGMLAHAAVDGTWQSGTVRTLLLVHAMALWRLGPALPWRVPVGLFWAPVSVMVACAAPVGYAQVLERQALRLDRLAARQGVIDGRALARLRRAGEWNPLDPDPLAAAASIHVRAQDWEGASRQIEAAVRRAPARPELRRLAMATYARAAAHGAGSVATALRRLEHGQVLLQLQPMQALDRYAYAQAALGLGYAQAARSALAMAVRLEPNFRLGFLALAGLHPLEAEAHLEAAAAIRRQMLTRYCEDRQSECKIHLRRVMTRLEIKLLGDLVDANDRSAVVERFASWPRPPLAPWPGASR